MCLCVAFSHVNAVYGGRPQDARGDTKEHSILAIVLFVTVVSIWPNQNTNSVGIAAVQ